MMPWSNNRKRTRMKTLNIVWITCLVFFHFAMAQYKIPHSTFGTGGAQTSSGSHKINGTLGQPVIGVTGNPTYMNQLGFWYQSGVYITGVDQLTEEIPTEYRLDQNYPNPFNPATTIRFSLPREEPVILTVFDILGQEVARLVNEKCKTGVYSVTFDAKGLSSGTYIYQLQAGNFVNVKKLLLLK